MLSCIVYFSTIISLSGAISCLGSAKYTLTFQAEWTKETHPEDFPSGDDPHFSSLVGCSHNTGYRMWKPGINATKGVKNVAELGKFLVARIIEYFVVYIFVNSCNSSRTFSTKHEILVTSSKHFQIVYFYF